MVFSSKKCLFYLCEKHQKEFYLGRWQSISKHSYHQQFQNIFWDLLSTTLSMNNIKINYFRRFTLKRQKQPSEVFLRRGVFRNFAKFTGKKLCQSLFLNKIADLRLATSLKKRLWHKCFPVNFPKFLSTTFIQNTSGGYF